MVEIEYQPCKKIVVHEIRRMKTPDFFQWVASGAEAQKAGLVASVSWANGIAFTVRPFFPTPHVLDDGLKGIIHYLAVCFTKTNFEDEKKGPLKDGRPYAVRLVKVDHDPNLWKLVRYLKRFPPEECLTAFDVTGNSESGDVRLSVPMISVPKHSAMDLYR